MKIQLNHLVLTAFALCLGGCATNSIKHSWKAPSYQGGPVPKLCVLAVDDRLLVRQGFENRFARDLHKGGQQAVTTHDLLGLSEIKENREAAVARVRAAGADAVLIVRLVDQTTYNREVQATPEIYAPVVTGYANTGWYDYYSIAYMDMGVVWGSMSQDIYLDSTLFDLKTGQRLWSALTLTVIKENQDRLVVADSLVAKIVKAMRKDGVVR